MQTVSQTLAIQRHLAKGHSITQREASRKFGIDRLAARIYDLRFDWPIEKEMVNRNGKRFARYWMVRT